MDSDCLMDKGFPFTVMKMSWNMTLVQTSIQFWALGFSKVTFLSVKSHFAGSSWTIISVCKALTEFNIQHVISMLYTDAYVISNFFSVFIQDID